MQQAELAALRANEAQDASRHVEEAELQISISTGRQVQQAQHRAAIAKQMEGEAVGAHLAELEGLRLLEAEMSSIRAQLAQAGVLYSPEVVCDTSLPPFAGMMNSQLPAIPWGPPPECVQPWGPPPECVQPWLQHFEGVRAKEANAERFNELEVEIAGLKAAKAQVEKQMVQATKAKMMVPLREPQDGQIGGGGQIANYCKRMSWIGE
jgi:hypothetical protein